MNIKRRLIITGVITIGLLLLGLFFASAMHTQEGTATVTSGNGVHTTTFVTAQGKVKVYLPNDMAAGDTISGTVIVVPNGNSDQERTTNEGVLNGYVLSLNQPNVTEKGTAFNLNLPVSSSSRFTFNLPSATTIPTNASGLGMSLTKADGTLLIGSSTVIPINPATTTTAPTQAKFNLPTIGQTGRPLIVVGPFDGNSANTSGKVGGQDVQQLVESPRWAVFTGPINITGPTEISVKEGNTETKGEYRNLAVKLTAPTTTLMQGEIITVSIQVSGLRGIRENVPLNLTKGGVVDMEGGDSQTRTIKPDEVSQGGIFSMTRTITGQQAGAFTVTATIVVVNDPTSTPTANQTPSPTPTSQPSSTPMVQPSPTPQPQSTPSTQPTPGGNTTTGPGTTTAPPPCELQGQVVHVEKAPNGGGEMWIIEIKLPDGTVIKIRIKGKKPPLKYCNWIKIKACHTEKGETYIDDWEKTIRPKPPKPPVEPPKPDDTKPVPPSPAEPPKPPAPPPGPAGGGDKTEPVQEPPCKNGEEKTNRRYISCELSDAVVVPLGQTPTSNDLIKIFIELMKVLRAGEGVDLGTNLAEAFTTKEARYIYVKFNTTYEDETWVCKNGKWVLKGSVKGQSETGWIQLFDGEGKGGFNWLPGSTINDVKTAIDNAKPAGCP